MKGQLIKRPAACIVAALICVLVASHAQTKLKQSNQALAAGRLTFESSCAPCHGLNGRGGERAPDIATKPEIVSLPDSQTLKVLRDEILEKGMSPFAALGRAKLSEVLNYLRSMQGKGRAPAVTASTEEGKNIFTRKAGSSR